MVEKYLGGIEKPGRYIGCEGNARKKDFDSASVRFALAFPDVYEVGLSHLGLQLLYHLLNGTEDVMADRAYAPWPDFEARLREVGEPLRGIESGRPLSIFDFLGFSLQYELSYSNILTILDLAGVPLESKDRAAGHPFVIGGGPCVFNPEPLAAIFDFFVLGEAEEVLIEIVHLFKEWRGAGGSREEFLLAVRKIEGVYVPSFFDVSYSADGAIAAVTPRFSDYTHVRKRLITDLDAGAPVPERPLVPVSDIVHNRLGLEIARGCTRGCRFCQAGFIYRPVRERDPRRVLESARKALAGSGFEELSLLSLSTGDYCQVQGLLAALTAEHEPAKVAVSLPSMRVGTLTPEMMGLVKKVRKTGFTLAPEAGSERLRRVINKGILDDDLLAAAETAFSLGWRVLKLYFMMGLPGERDEDRESLIELSLKVWEKAKKSRSAVNIAVGTFVPKAQTPFQWAAQLTREEIETNLRVFKDRLRKPGLRLKWGLPAHSALEAVFARGDRRTGAALVAAWRHGARYDGWTELFREDIWEGAFRETVLDPAFFGGRARPLDEILPWDHLSSGVKKEYLVEEYLKSLAGEYTPDCRRDRCTVCGVCDHKTVSPVVYREEVFLPAPGSVQEGRDSGGEYRQAGISPKSGTGPRPEPEFLYAITYSKLGRARFFGQLETARAFSRAVRRAGLPAAYSKGFHPHVKLSFDEALPLGIESTVAEAYLSLVLADDTARMRQRLNESLPEGLRVERIRRVEKRDTPVFPVRATYRVSELGPFLVRHILQRWPQHLDAPVVKKTKRGEARAVLGDVLLDVRRCGDNCLEVDICERADIIFRPMAVLMLLAGEYSENLSGCRICKTAAAGLAAGREESEDALRAHNQ